MTPLTYDEVAVQRALRGTPVLPIHPDDRAEIIRRLALQGALAVDYMRALHCSGSVGRDLAAQAREVAA